MSLREDIVPTLLMFVFPSICISLRSYQGLDRQVGQNDTQTLADTIRSIMQPVAYLETAILQRVIFKS